MSLRAPLLFVSDDEIAAIGRGVLDLSLPKPRWTHARLFCVEARRRWVEPGVMSLPF